MQSLLREAGGVSAQWKPERMNTHLTLAARVETARPDSECLEAQLLGMLRQGNKVKGSLSTQGDLVSKWNL